VNGMAAEQKTGQALRYNRGKLRFDLVHPWAHEQLVKVFTMGADKYAPRNWEKGMSWTSVIASLKRHLNAIESGEDFDAESGLLHSAHVMWGAHALTAYYKLFPQGDDRQHKYMFAYDKKIGLDIDEVLCDWTGGWCRKFNTTLPATWHFDYAIASKFKEMQTAGTLEDFYLSLTPKTLAKDIPFEPHCYITSRPVAKEVTMQWLEKHGYPCKPVYNVEPNQSKVEVAKQSQIDIFVDDRYENFVELNKSGVCCYLFDAPHNQMYDVGHKRIKSLKDL
jgi:uncharacterized HAD superfamily protein